MFNMPNCRRIIVWSAIVVQVFVVQPVFAQQAELLNSFDELGLEDILNMSVTTAAGREQNLIEVSNAMTVLTREDIDRSGARQLQDLFVRIPGMQVIRYDAHLTGVSIRRSPSVLTNSLLVLVDGVVVFNPSFSGTLWQSIPVTLDEIERIEVIRGPGGVRYSSNAVSGVVNIITRSASDTGKYVNLEDDTLPVQKDSLSAAIA